HAFKRRVVQVQMRELDLGLRQRIRIDGEVVIVRGDFDFAGVQLLHRMIAAMVPELQLESFAAECKAGELMSETDAKDGLTPHEAADVVHRISAWLGIAGAGGEKD